MSAGKGDKPRPVNKKNFNKNYEEINWKKNDSKIESKVKKNKVSYLYK
jgi:hypothetical protein